MEVKVNLPLLPLRDIVVFPHMVAPLFVGRKQSVNALNSVMTGDKKIFLLAQKNSEVDNPNESNLYKFGTIAKVLQLLKLPDGTIKVLVEGLERSIVDKINIDKDFITANISSIDTSYKINTNIKNYDFLKIKKNNNFLLKIPIKNYLHIHLDEKWFKNLYIDSYSDINPSYNAFVDFVKNLALKSNVLITTGIIDFDLIQNLKIKFFQKKTDNIYLKNYSNTSVYFIYMPTFNDIESLLRNAKILITCHGAVTHVANSFNVKIVDIIEENRKVFYQRYTSYLKKYNPIYRAKFDILKDDLLDIIRE